MVAETPVPENPDNSEQFSEIDVDDAREALADISDDEEYASTPQLTAAVGSLSINDSLAEYVTSDIDVYQFKKPPEQL